MKPVLPVGGAIATVAGEEAPKVKPVSVEATAGTLAPKENEEEGAVTVVDVTVVVDGKGATGMDGNVITAESAASAGVTVIAGGLREAGRTMAAVEDALAPVAAGRKAGGNSAADGRGLPEKLTPWAIGRAWKEGLGRCEVMEIVGEKKDCLLQKDWG